MSSLIELREYPVKDVLSELLMDRTSGKNIILGTDDYEGYEATTPITEKLLLENDSLVIQPRVGKQLDQQLARTKAKAEVFTPSWACNRMNNYCDADWFGRKNVFNTEIEDGLKWETVGEKVTFPPKKDWESYIQSTRLELACGEAPYLVSRYDVTTGSEITIAERIGILDRKLRVVNENTENEVDWLEWTLKAYQSVYGFEFQGDNLLIARINLLATFVDYMKARWNRDPSIEELKTIANVIVWNIWQMDGLTEALPLSKKAGDIHQNELFAYSPESSSLKPEDSYCKIFDWRVDQSLAFNSIEGSGKMKFDYCIGNPPYQDETSGEQKKYAPPVYNLFMDNANKIADKVLLIHPARFLFNAGGTPAEWNQKMLDDPHFKVLFHSQDSSSVFSNTDIKGGVAITFHDNNKLFGAIGTYTVFEELNSILSKVKSFSGFSPFDTIIAHRGLYRFSKLAYQENSEEMNQLSDSRVGSSAFERLSFLFTEEKPNDNHTYVQFFGLCKKKRVYRWFRKDYFNMVESFDKYKVFVPKSNGSGALGEVLSTPVIGQPVIGHTETFISIGAFDTESEAQACYKYICTKFCRVLLGVLKSTQDNPPEKWKYVPLQDFTNASDIDWSVPIKSIDQQLYRKYGLDEKEIRFIETNVKEME